MSIEFQHHVVSPSMISSYLLLIDQNITTLNLTIKDAQPVENSLLNLRDHRALRELSVHRNLLFGCDAGYRPANRYGLSKQLPPYLEPLRVWLTPHRFDSFYIFSRDIILHLFQLVYLYTHRSYSLHSWPPSNNTIFRLFQMDRCGIIYR